MVTCPYVLITSGYPRRNYWSTHYPNVRNTATPSLLSIPSIYQSDPICSTLIMASFIEPDGSKHCLKRYLYNPPNYSWILYPSHTSSQKVHYLDRGEWRYVLEMDHRHQWFPNKTFIPRGFSSQPWPCQGATECRSSSTQDLVEPGNQDGRLADNRTLRYITTI